MSPRTKKLIGAMVLLVWIPIYALIAMGVAVHVLPHAHWTVSLLYYALAGTLWIIPIGLMLPWMNREPQRHR
jgi:membrane protein implicated in regulation of membrane protease activity